MHRMLQHRHMRWGTSQAGAPSPTDTQEAKGNGGACETLPRPQKRRLDPKDFMFMGLQGQMRVKLPGCVRLLMAGLCACAC